jgi:hypothetical protein
MTFSGYMTLVIVKLKFWKAEVKIKIEDGDGRHIENRQKAVSQAPTDGF